MQGRHRSAPSRAIVIITTVVVALVLLLASSVGASGEPEPDSAALVPATRTYIVRSGDTLWEIADEVKPDGGDVRATVGVIRTINDLERSVIRPGQRLQVPATG